MSRIIKKNGKDSKGDQRARERERKGEVFKNYLLPTNKHRCVLLLPTEDDRQTEKLTGKLIQVNSFLSDFTYILKRLAKI